MVKYALLEPALLVSEPDSGLTERKLVKLTASVKEKGFKNPISVRFDGRYRVTWGHSRALVAKILHIPIPAIIFEDKPQPLGDEVDDPTIFFDSPVVYRPHRKLIRPKDKFW